MPDAKCQMPDARYQIPDARCQCQEISLPPNVNRSPARWREENDMSSPGEQGGLQLQFISMNSKQTTKYAQK